MRDVLRQDSLRIEEKEMVFISRPDQGQQVTRVPASRTVAAHVPVCWASCELPFGTWWRPRAAAAARQAAAPPPEARSCPRYKVTIA